MFFGHFFFLLHEHIRRGWCEASLLRLRFCGIPERKMAEGDGAFDFEALDDDSSELSALVTATPSSSVAGEEGEGTAPLQEENGLDAATVRALATSLSSLRPQFITVLSDFGETEKFVVEGDSLLLHAFSGLDWTHGGQFLHLTYVVETFLHELVTRGAHFCVVFFESHKAIWKDDPAKCVARSLVIRHLQTFLPATHTTSVKTFKSPACDAWTEFFDTYLPCLVVASDELPTVPDAKISPMRGFLLDMVVAGVNVMLLRDIEILDHQLRGYYLPGRGVRHSKIGVCNALYEDVMDVDESELTKVGSFVNGGAGEALDNDWGLVALSWACTQWCKTANGDQDKLAAARLVLIHAVLLRSGSVPLANRAHVMCAGGDMFSEFQKTVLEVLGGMLKVLADSAWCKDEAQHFGTSIHARTACDFIDARLLLSLAAAAEPESCTAETLGLDGEAQAMAAKVWKTVAQESGPDFLPRIIIGNRCKLEDIKTQPSLKPADAHQLHKIGKDTILGGILEPMGGLQFKDDGVGETASISNSCLAAKGWKIEDVLSSFIWTHCRDQTATDAPANTRSMSEWERRKALRRKARQNQMYFRHLHEYAASLTGTTVLGATSISANVEVSDSDSQSSVQVEDGSVQGEDDEDKGSKKGGKGGGKEKKPKEKKLSKKEQM
jgi:hypothetical protein